ncbi:MAG: cupin domain-containing protein, partial [Prochlorococcus sp.]
MKDNAVSELIGQFELTPPPEGGWFRELIRIELTVQQSDGHKRNAITGILFLLGKSDKSRWHRVNGADEIWIHLQGGELNIWQ